VSSSAAGSSRSPIGLAPSAAADAVGQDAAKYSSTNRVVAALLDRWLGRVSALVPAAPGVIVDVGVGEGFALERLLPPDVVAVGVEYRFDKVHAAAARLSRLRAVRGDAGMLPLAGGSADLVTCTEVLEHLTAPERAVAELARITRGRCLVSVPWEPWFRLGNLGRGKNVSRLGNDVEHVQHFSARRLRLLLEREFATVEVVSSFPWLIGIGSDARPLRSS
jgi:SAM-dependent methyltransferase